MGRLRQWVNDKTNQVGLLAGGIGLVVSVLGRPFNLGRELGDPLPVVLSFSQALRGSLIYLNWRGVILHLLFILFLIGLVFALAHLWLPEAQRQAIRVNYATGLATGLNVTAVAFGEVDAVVVGVWYLMAGFISVYIAVTLASGVEKLRGSVRG